VDTALALHAKGRELARAAVCEERLRFARDIHDSLGRSLSIIALKAQMARCLACPEPERSLVELEELEAVAREALQDLRAAVSGYRQPTLAAELVSAHELLATAGIECHWQALTDSLAAEQDTVLAWVVGEGATNVLRHSRARRCSIGVAQSAGWTSIEVVDDGRGRATSSCRREVPAEAGWPA
jgi:two-component system sensor histidine kinase DesK